MKNLLTKLYVKAQILREDKGQDMVEYALVASLIALGAVAGMGPVATAINTSFNAISTKLNQYN